MNTSSISIRNKIQSLHYPVHKNYSKFSFIQKKGFLTINKHIINNSNMITGNSKKISINLLKGLSRNNYCEKIGNLVMLNSKNEIKITFEEKTFSIFFNETDSINVVNEKILGINEKIQSIEFMQFESKETLSEELKNSTLMKELIKNPFVIRINKHISLNYIPGVFPQLFAESELINEFQSKNQDYFKSNEDIKNVILLCLYDLREKNLANLSQYEKEKACYISDILKKLDNREKFLKSLFEKQTLSEKMVNEKLVFVSNFAVRMGMLFAISHFSVFYALIYKIYAWDVIEPITYIVGNIYWIISLGFLALKNRKFEFQLLEYESIKENSFNKYAKQLNYSEEEMLKLQEELQSIEQLRSGNIRMIDPRTDSKQLNNSNNNQYNYLKNTMNQNERIRNSKTPENKRIKKSLSSEKIQRNNRDNNQNDKKQVDVPPQMTNDLLFNINDDFQTLIYKNSKLREFIENSVEEVKRQAEVEKEEMISQLDRITNNYKLYSDYYSKYFELVDKITVLENDYRHNNKVMSGFKESLKKLFYEKIEDYKQISDFISSISYGSKGNLNNERIVELNEHNIKRAFDFILDFKQNLFSCLNENKSLIDRVNFPEIWVMLKNTIQMPHFKFKIHEVPVDIRRSDSREKINQNLNKSTGNGSFRSLKNNEISFNSKYNTIQIDNETNTNQPKNNSVITNKKNFINYNNKENSGQHINKLISKSHSADSFYVTNNIKKNNAFRSKKSYSFNKNFIRDSSLINSINHYSDVLFNPISKNQNNNQSLTMSHKNQKYILEEPQNEPNNQENIDLNGLFYNERFCHYKKENKRSYKSITDSFDHDKNNLSRSSSKKKNFIKDNSKIIRNNYSSIDLNNSLIRENNEESKSITSTKNNFNQSKEFSRDSLDNKSKILSQNVLVKENLVSPNVSVIDGNKKPDNRLNDSNAKSEENERINNCNYRYDLYNEKGENYKNGFNNQKDDQRIYQTQIYRAYLKQDYFIESLKIKLNKGSIVDVIFIGDSNQNEFLEKNFHENEGESEMNDISSSKCYLIYDGNHYRIPRESVEIQKF